MISANGKPVHTIAELKAVAAAATKAHKNLLLNVLRGPSALFVVIK